MPGSLIWIYQGLEEENLDQKSPGPPGWGLMQRASSSLTIKKQEMLKKQTQLECNSNYVRQSLFSVCGLVELKHEVFW